MMRLRPTLRLRLTLLNALLLLGAGTLLLILCWLLVGDALRPAEDLAEGARVVLANGGETDAQSWQQELAAAAQTELFAKGAVAVLAITLVGVAGAYAVAGRALRPLHQVTATAQKLSEETLDQRINYAGADDEVAELADTFDAMLDRIGAAFTAQQRFVANASHELRTPLAVMRTEIDVTMDGPGPSDEPQEWRHMATVVREASERANALVDALLMLARSEARTGLRAEPFDLAIGVVNALSAMDPEVRRLGLRVTSNPQPALVIGDPSLLDRLAGNLIENAVRYNHLGGRIEVETRHENDRAILLVRNTGFVVAQADVAGLFEPFRRGGRERTGARGSGLGLSIVRAVCRAHDGTVEAVPQHGGGLEITITLPRSADPDSPA